MACAAAPVRAQDGGGGGRGTSLSASVETGASYVVDNRRNGGNGLGGGEFVAELRPGLRLESRSGRLVGSLSYLPSLAYHSRGYGSDDIQNQLSGNLSAELIERWFYVDATASITQQAASAFGVQSAPGSRQDNNNRTEVGTLSVSPYVRGVFGSAVTYEARLNASATNGRRSIAADSSSQGGSLSLASSVSGTLIGWGLQASQQQTDFRAGRETTSDRITASLQFQADADLILTLRVGQEANNVATASRKSYDNWGAGLTWRPSPRTRLQADTDDRYFGRSYRVLFEHRLASSTVLFSSTRDANNGSDANGLAVQPGQAGQRVTLYDLFFAQFASTTPDPVQRDQLVRSFMRAQGLDPNAVVAGGFINSAVTVQERHQLTLSYAGLRMAGSVQVFASDTAVIDALASSAQQRPTRQWGALANASYRLSPTSSLALTGSRLLTRANGLLAGATLDSVSLSYASSLSLRASATLGARYSIFDSVTEPYKEAAVFATLNQRF
ncbi:MAG: TIGR03016 family PEP-CTERM system-associated outer membrane protein [Rubrivivax sp.]|nr:TIGR03016 family PEP-CTERM system-associated outer membrane protein [Rubrivivax sp.]